MRSLKKYRAFIIPAAGLVLVAFGWLTFNLLNDNLVYFRTPTEVLNDADAAGRMRLGGQVVPGTVVQTEANVRFEVGDGQNVVQVIHEGTPAQLFQEGIGVVVEGRWDGNEFRSDTMLIKHDEQYRTEDGGTYKPESQEVVP